ncbi:amino acid ABC transporter permease [Brenneria goodwinii]|uniref:Histidine/lysine/arginine/ornithine transport system permease protein HisM n=1 Tax=Brenneria goodwinii TaxID=1109412 RepID=A0AAE8ETJ6_9GAMM|nr:histidine ABC transporter permease HisM [Brenneria goodwinii]ATA26272.1 amino acid ABC transporter permease [Brenneria goodwinii]RLM28737.1 amino acid ABC transporter permease [Brenneria goodwinii]
MIEILKEYGMAYLWHDGYHYSGLLVTCWLLLLSLLMGFVLSLPLAVARASQVRWLSRAVWCFTYVFRGTPLYIQLLIIYTGIYSLEFVRAQPMLDAFFRNGFYCAVLALGLNTTAFTTEVFAGAIKGIAHGEVEAARAYGLHRFTLYRKIILPAALRRALPYYSNEVILMLHATSIAFTATVADLLKVAGDVNAETYMSFQAYGIAAAIYLVTTCVLIALFRQGEKRWLAFIRPRGQ